MGVEVVEEVVLGRGQIEQHHRSADQIVQRERGLGGEGVAFGDDHVRRGLEQRLELDAAVEIDVVRDGDVGLTGLQVADHLDEVTLVHGQLEVRVPGCEAPDDLAEQERSGDEVAADLELADDCLADSLRPVVESPLRLQEPACLCDERAPGRGQRQPPGRIAHEQPISVSLLEPLDRGADRGRRNLERRTGPGDASVVGGGDHVGEVSQVDGHRLLIKFSEVIQNFPLEFESLAIVCKVFGPFLDAAMNTDSDRGSRPESGRGGAVGANPDGFAHCRLERGPRTHHAVDRIAPARGADRRSPVSHRHRGSPVEPGEG